MNYPSARDDWKTCEKNNPTIGLNGLYVKAMNIYLAYILKYNSNHEKQIILFMILNRGEWHYLVLRNYQQC